MTDNYYERAPGFIYAAGVPGDGCAFDDEIEEGGYTWQDGYWVKNTAQAAIPAPFVALAAVDCADDDVPF
jgi:hypothetical protein